MRGIVVNVYVHGTDDIPDDEKINNLLKYVAKDDVAEIDIHINEELSIDYFTITYIDGDKTHTKVGNNAETFYERKDGKIIKYYQEN
jgi:hypothetical protein